MPKISPLRRLRQEDHKFEASLGYITRLSQEPIKKDDQEFITLFKEYM
jgi:hypothetical protein